MKKEERSALRQEVLQERSRRAGLEFDSNLHSLVPESDQPPVIRAGWKITERLVAEMKGDLDELGVPLISVVVPFVNTFDVDWVDNHNRQGRPLVAEHATAAVESILVDLEVPVISVRQRISASGMNPHSFFHTRETPNDRHLSRIGHRSVAAWILDELRDINLTERTAPAAHLPAQ
jgi:hypothetical protein